MNFVIFSAAVSSKIAAFITLGFIVVAIVTVLVLLTIGIISQLKYDNSSLPSFEEIDPQANIIEIDDEEVQYAFDVDDYDDHPIEGDEAAETLLKDVKAMEGYTEKTSFNPFSRK